MDPDDVDDLDLTLRHVTRRFPFDLARALLPPGTVITAATWTETQLTSRQRRLDRAMEVVADGQRRFEHMEVQLRMHRAVPFRVFEYQALLALALAGETPAGQAVPCIESTVVLLSGRRRPWPERGEYRLSPPGAQFSGVSFRIDAVYQRTVSELWARGSPLWMVFAPLAVDADAERMKEVIEQLRAESSAEEFAALAAGLWGLAGRNKRRRGLREVILGLLSEEEVMRNPVFEMGERRGRRDGLQEGALAGKQELVTRLFEKRLGRPLAEAERAALLRRLGSLGAEKLLDVGLDLDPDALAAWLAEPDAA